MNTTSKRLALVAIGRNEGERLRRCLESVRALGLEAVYVDSGSSDGSVELARSLGVEVVELDPSRPFTAARGRMEGASRMLELRPELEFLMFLDGDCELDADWPDAALRFFDDHERVGVVCGRRRELFPDASLYNRFIDVEWDTPVGEALFSGGDFVIRTEAYREAGGWDPSPIAGEEPELCKRVRAQGWKVHRIDHEMTRHDVAMSRFGQWWKRQVRTGHGGSYTENHFAVGVFKGIIRSAWVWGVAIPLAFVIGAAIAAATGGPIAGLTVLGVGFGLFALQCFRVALHARRGGRGWRDSLEFGLLTMLSKPAILIGAIKFHWEQIRRRQSRLIEYNAPAGDAST